MDKMKFKVVLWHRYFTEKKKLQLLPLKNNAFFFSENDPSSSLLSCLNFILVQVSEIFQSITKKNSLLRRFGRENN